MERVSVFISAAVSHQATNLDLGVNNGITDDVMSWDLLYSLLAALLCSLIVPSSGLSSVLHVDTQLFIFSPGQNSH